MADDTSYSTFLSKANNDPSSGSHQDPTHVHSTSQSRSKYDPTTSPLSPQTSQDPSKPAPPSYLPTALQSLPEITYTSDTDSDFEPVFFSYASDEAPSLDDFKLVLKAKKGYGEHGGEDMRVEELSVEEWDPRGQYKEVVGCVQQAGVEERKGRERGDGDRRMGGEMAVGDDGDVKVFRVEVSATRVEYFVLTVGERKLVGVVANAVES